MHKTIVQKRASDAYYKVNKILENNDQEWQKKYSSYAKSLPATIIMNGLGQAAATLLSSAKGDKSSAHHVLYEHLEDWLCNENANTPYKGSKDLMAAIINNDRYAYIKAQIEALAWLEWLKKFATAYLKQEGED